MLFVFSFMHSIMCKEGTPGPILVTAFLLLVVSAVPSYAQQPPLNTRYFLFLNFELRAAIKLRLRNSSPDVVPGGNISPLPPSGRLGSLGGHGVSNLIGVPMYGMWRVAESFD